MIIVVIATMAPSALRWDVGYSTDPIKWSTDLSSSQLDARNRPWFTNAICCIARL